MQNERIFDSEMKGAICHSCKWQMAPISSDAIMMVYLLIAHIFHSFEAENRVSDFSYKWLKNEMPHIDSGAHESRLIP